LDPRDFVLANTRLAAPPLVPEVRLHLASEITPLWEATEAALARQGLPPPYWAFAWPGGQALARWLLDHAETVRGRRVFDFAAGSGLGAIAAGLAGAAAAEANDIDAWAAAAQALNAAANGVAVAIDVADRVGETALAADIVLAGDVCYEQPMSARIVPWLQQLAGDGRMVLVADPGRAYLPPDRLFRELACYCVPTTRELEDREERLTRVLQVLG
jgi:predicted nicotinamide N-methyase